MSILLPFLNRASANESLQRIREEVKGYPPSRRLPLDDDEDDEEEEEKAREAPAEEEEEEEEVVRIKEKKPLRKQSAYLLKMIHAADPELKCEKADTVCLRALVQRHVEELYVDSTSDSELKDLALNLASLAHIIAAMHISTSTMRSGGRGERSVHARTSHPSTHASARSMHTHTHTHCDRNDFVHYTAIGKEFLASKGERYIKGPQIDVWRHHLKAHESLVIEYLDAKEKRLQEKLGNKYSVDYQDIVKHTRRMYSAGLAEDSSREDISGLALSIMLACGCRKGAILDHHVKFYTLKSHKALLTKAKKPYGGLKFGIEEHAVDLDEGWEPMDSVIVQVVFFLFE